MVRELPDPSYISAPQAAKMCGVTRNTMCTWIRQGHVPSYKTLGGRNLIRPDDLVSFMDENQMFVPAALREMAEKGAAREHEEAIDFDDTHAVLIVDDDRDARALAQRCLASLDVPILEAESGYEALHLITKHPNISLVILDIVMPGQQGTETFAEIRKQNFNVPVLVVSGHAPGLNELRRTEPTPNRIMAKPYEIAALRQAAIELMDDSPCA